MQKKKQKKKTPKAELCFCSQTKKNGLEQQITAQLVN